MAVDVANLEELVKQMEGVEAVSQRLKILDAHPEVQSYMASSKSMDALMKQLTPEQQYNLKAVMAIGQGPTVFQDAELTRESLLPLLQQLRVLEDHYSSIGGIIGYQATMLRLISEKQSGEKPTYTRYFHPPGVDLRTDSDVTSTAVRWGLENLPKMGEILPIGGAGDRLDLLDAETGNPLPAALLQLNGHSLLEGIIRDLEGREHLYYQLYGEMIKTPIALMTSNEKDNHKHIVALLEENNWFDRGEENFAFFIQERVPMVTEEGNWAMEEPLSVMRKPGGHGVLWKLMEEQGIFDWFETKGRTKALVRQINNPVAGVDNGLLAFTGLGSRYDKAFGFAACDRKVGAAEGTLVLFERKDNGQHSYGITNIEYPELEKHGIKDEPEEPGTPFSKFPANTNILFCDLKAVRNKIDECPLPGMLINMKKSAPCLCPTGEKKELHVGRLETTMQNIADHFTMSRETEMDEGSRFVIPTFVTYNERRKTLSVTKNSWCPGCTSHDTPVWAEYERLLNNYELLKEYCGMELPEIGGELDDPSFYFTYHPALGPLWSIIGQKVQGGRLHKNAELRLEISSLKLQNLDLKGSLLINSQSSCGSVQMTNVKVQNAGIDTNADNIFWKGQIARKEALEIHLQGDGEFIAEGVTFQGSEKIVVPAGHRVIARQEEDTVLLEADPLPEGKHFHWNHAFDAHNNIKLS